MSSPPALICEGCGTEVPVDEPLPFCCPRRNGDDADHVLQRVLTATAFAVEDGDNPFVRYRRLSTVYRLARARGIEDARFVQLALALDDAVQRVDGRGFRVTPLRAHQDGALQVKDETGNVAGSHKARHLMGIALHLQALSYRDQRPSGPLAIASCGNAALAAAVLARAMDERLRVFVPADADAATVARLRELGAEVEVCARAEDVAGDPCYHAFRVAVAGGAVPFCVQGPDNALTLDGGRTLAYELVEAWASAPADAVVIQVGGGALASATWQGLAEAYRLGALPALPRIYAVQTQGAAPLRRAYQRVRARDVADPAAALAYAARHRSEFMWPWESTPRSVAHAILDDETYDWLSVVGGMLETRGRPVVVSEAALRAAHREGHALGYRVSHTGTAGLAAIRALQKSGELGPGARAVALFTGVARSND